MFQFGERLKLYFLWGHRWLKGAAYKIILCDWWGFAFGYDKWKISWCLAFFMPHCVVRMCMTLSVCVYHMSVTIPGWSSNGDRIGTGPSSSNELGTQSSTQAAWSFGYESSDSEADRPDPDLLLDDLASRRFHAPSVITPTNFALPMTTGVSTTIPQTTRPNVMVTNMPRSALTYLRSDTPQRLLCINIT